MQMTTGERIAATRRREGLRQDELAELAGVSTSTLALIERGKQSPRLSLVADLAKALGVETMDLVG